MNKAKEALKAELLELYSQALDEMLEAYPEQADFAVLEAHVEKHVAYALDRSPAPALDFLTLRRGVEQSGSSSGS